MSCDAMNVMKLWTEYDAFYHMWDIRSDEYYFIKLSNKANCITAEVEYGIMNVV